MSYIQSNNKNQYTENASKNRHLNTYISIFFMQVANMQQQQYVYNMIRKLFNFKYMCETIFGFSICNIYMLYMYIQKRTITIIIIITKANTTVKTIKFILVVVVVVYVCI